MLKYGKKDAIIALCVFIVLVALSLVDEVLTTNFEAQATIFQFTSRIIIIVVVFSIVLLKKQGLASIGFHKDKLRSMLKFGIIITLILSAFGIVPGLIHGWEFNSFGVVIPILFTTIIMAAGEDIFFVGYLQTRLYGLFKKDVPAIFAGAVLFALAHVPGLLIGFHTGWITMWIIWLIGHTLMVLIFRRHFSIIPVIIVHSLANFFSTGGLWCEYSFDYNEDWSGIAIILIFLVLLILEIVRYNRAKKEQV